MHLFLFGLVSLVIGYMIYGTFVEQILRPDDRPTRSLRRRCRLRCLAEMENALIQLLNIAGIGPVIGVILGSNSSVVS